MVAGTSDEASTSSARQPGLVRRSRRARGARSRAAVEGRCSAATRASASDQADRPLAAQRLPARRTARPRPGRPPARDQREPPRVVAHRRRRAQLRRDLRQQPGGELDHLGGHAEAAVEHLDVRVGLARGAAARPSQSLVAHGVVPWAMSPSTVAEPVEQRRPTARSCIGERSCASSRTTWPRLGVRSTRSAASSTQHGVGERPARRRRDRAAAWPTAAAPAPRRSRTPSAASARKSASESSRSTSAPGRRAGHSASTYALHRRGCGRPRPAPGRRATRRRPPSRSRTACARRCGEHRRGAAPYRTPRARSSSTISRTSYAGTRQRREPRGTHQRLGRRPRPVRQTARRSTSAIRGVALEHGDRRPGSSRACAPATPCADQLRRGSSASDVAPRRAPAARRAM